MEGSSMALILENYDVSFTLKQYQRKRDEICQKFNVFQAKLIRFLKKRPQSIGLGF